MFLRRRSRLFTITATPRSTKAFSCAHTSRLDGCRLSRLVARVGGPHSVDFVKRVNYGRITQPKRRSRCPQPTPATGRRVATSGWP